MKPTQRYNIEALASLTHNQSFCHRTRPFQVATILTHFRAMFPFYAPLKTPENQRFFSVFRGCRMGILAQNGISCKCYSNQYSCFVTTASCKFRQKFFENAKLFEILPCLGFPDSLKTGSGRCCGLLFEIRILFDFLTPQHIINMSKTEQEI